MDIDDDDDEFILCELAAEFGSGDDAAPAADLLTQRGVNVPEELNDPDWNEYWRLYRIALAECLAALHPPRALREGQGMPPGSNPQQGGGRKTRRKKRRLRRKRKKHTTRRRKTRRRRTRRRRRRRR